jgi:hypothetical protein
MSIDGSRARPTPRERVLQLQSFLARLEASRPGNLQLRVVLQVAPGVMPSGWLLRPAHRLDIVPNRASWPNVVDQWLARLTQRPIECGAHASMRSMEDALHGHFLSHDKRSTPFLWTHQIHHNETAPCLESASTAEISDGC